MAYLFGKNMSRQEILSYIGNLSQVIDARESVLTSGKAEGVRAIDVKTGSGLCFTVLPSRGMDIAWAEYQGKPLSFLSRSGVVKPEYLSYTGEQSDRSFMGGLLSTCGLTNVGPPPEGIGFHGRIGNIPAHDVGITRGWTGDEYELCIRGKVSEACIMEEDLELSRTIRTFLGGKKIIIEDVIENRGCTTQPLMVLWHINFGYPVVSPESKLYLSAPTTVRMIGTHNASAVERIRSFDLPQPGREHEVFQHSVEKKGEFCACILNEALSIGAYIKFNTNEFAQFMQWKLSRVGEYVCALEPCTASSIGRAAHERAGTLPYIHAREVKRFHYEIGVVESSMEL